MTIPAPGSASSPPEASAATSTVRAATTPGLIACGSASCAVGAEFCFEPAGEAPRCLPMAEHQVRGMRGREEDALYLCDDAADCATGERCCASTWGGTGPGYHECTSQRCDDFEVCVPGGACSPGLRCAPRAGSAARAQCVPAAPGVACGQTRCEGATPTCCQNTATGASHCLPPGTAPEVCGGDGEAKLECKNRRDCGGYLCCVSLIGSTWCSSDCPGAAAGVACDSVTDCPPVGPGPGGMGQRYDRCENGTCTGDYCMPDGTWRRCDEM